MTQTAFWAGLKKDIQNTIMLLGSRQQLGNANLRQEPLLEVSM